MANDNDRLQEAELFRPSPLRIGFAPAILYLAVLSATVAIFQWASSCYSSEFGIRSDEPSHLTTGLFVLDYFQNFTTSPRAFADTFYCHYPKIGLGHWPPLFYIVQAIWYIFFGASRASALSLMGTLSTFVAFRVAILVRTYVGPRYALPTAIALIASPLFQQYSACVMTEMLLALLLLEAAARYAAYLAGRHPAWNACLFGLVASAAIMTKGVGLCLALVPLVSTILDRNYARSVTLTFWLPAAIVIILCGPYYYSTLDLQRSGWVHDSLSLWYTRHAARYYAIELITSAGIGGLLLFAIGAIRTLGMPSRLVGFTSSQVANGAWASLGALTASLLGFCVVIPCGLDERFLLPALPPIAIVAARGMQECFAFLGRFQADFRRPGWLMLILLIPLQFSGFQVYLKEWRGYGNAVAELIDASGEQIPVCLIVSDAVGDGLFISEAALAEKRPRMFALRASKLFASDTWNGRSYVPRFVTASEVSAVLDEIGVNFIVIDSCLTPSRTTFHDRLLVEVVTDASSGWRESTALDVIRDGQHFPSAIHIHQRIEMHSQDSSDTCATIRRIQGSKTGL